MTIKTVTAEEIFQNWSAMYDQFCAVAGPLAYPVMCAHCGIDEVYERFGSDDLCERCVALIGNVLASIHYGLEPDEDGAISLVP